MSASYRTARPADDGVSASRVLPLSASAAWDLLTDVRNHGRWVPFTRVTVDAGSHPAAARAGARFTAVTSPLPQGPGLVDRMVVEHLDPPHAPDDDALASPGDDALASPGDVGSPPPASDDRGPGRTGTARYRKLGPVLLGTAALHVRPLGPTTCEVRWSEDVHLRGLPRALTARPMRPVARAVVVLTLRRVAREVSRTTPAAPRATDRRAQA